MPKRVAALYDIHGNFLALEAVLADMKKFAPDEIVIGGDLAWGPEPVAVMERLMSLTGKIHFIRGNADREVAGRYGVGQGLEPWVADINLWCAGQLSASHMDFLGRLPEQKVLNMDGLGNVLFVHGSPRSDEESIRADTPEVEIMPMVKDVSPNMIVCGHTHIQFDRTVAGKRILNPGSVGLPSGTKGACWALIGPDIELRVTEYDCVAAAERIRRSGVPMAEDFAAHILHPPAEGP
ncbi:metallophosphoesterase family protein [Paenactinomyces guangxiensis]|uniref:Metallophosphoesterase family protein n=1 Tax=Paenactinomyces guangxiensis TaxID=1490290 RepID=A0A7W2A9G5_9BACL|nr:metallophosphoesterase family protein [Paenactinomyces guangxiensis]MBA4495229.1 metallophosphoesterase family protein [Paenactinomyces guangxiensis]MBH8592313.1 metallophosphoesterase family protein [Paenactinomyces guangxiensis]